MKKITITTVVFCLLMGIFLPRLLTSIRDRMAKEDIGKPEGFVVDLLLPTTPNRDQGETQLCWVYAMQAAIETDRLAMGDSVVFSPVWVERKSLEEQAFRYYKTGEKISLRGTLPEAMRLMEKYGVVAETGVVSKAMNHSSRELEQKVQDLVDDIGKKWVLSPVTRLLDDATAPMPRYVFMLGFEYTPRQFFESCCLPGEWKAFSSLDDHKYGEVCEFDVADNRQHHKALNIKRDSMLQMVYTSLAYRHPVAWEGGMGNRPTDDHCMAIIGYGHDNKHTRYLICKNSWANSPRYYMTEERFLKSTLLIMVKS